ncbi:hypothetical protein CSW60_18620 [Caulobacter sp. X]|nr:hypothetical protein CSW60_18620 [Caulobacter sp. X]
MERPNPVRHDRITLRVCADLNWSVYVSCAGCNYTYGLWPSRLAGGPLGAVPIMDLLASGALRCRTRCGGRPADGAHVSAMHVGMSHYLARWTVETVNGARRVRALPAAD